MTNLACNVDDKAAVERADHVVLYELRSARVEIVVLAERQHGEVPTRFAGKLGPFTLTRAWRYWVVKGPCPIELARLIYADPAAPEIRVAGHCGAPPPDEWATHFDTNGRKVLKTRERAVCDEHVDAPGVLGEISRQILAESVFSDDPGREAHVSIVDTYHVDSALGLRVWADYVRAWTKPWPSVEVDA